MAEERYCIYCGKKLETDTGKCPHCGRSTDLKDHLLREYLIRNTKEELQGSADEKLYTVIKNWLLTHLFGMVVAVSLITVLVMRTVSAGSAQPSYIETVHNNTRPDRSTAPVTEPEETAEEENREENNTPQTQTLSDDEIEAAEMAIETYAERYDIATSNAVIEDEDLWLDPRSLEELVLPASYGYNGPMEYEYIQGTPADHYVRVNQDFSDSLYMEAVSDLGKQLIADGFEVYETVFLQTYYYDMEATNLYADTSFRVVNVRIDGAWYIAGIYRLK